MIRSATSQQGQSRKQKAQLAAPRTVRRRLRPTRAGLAVLEGNSDADWQLWEDSVEAFDSQFPSMRDQFAHVDAFAGIYQER
ncbi:MAG TPA: hypothetical protein VN649_13130 [Ramlibacter sp.]|nr:hypothetical protein [Ramlibacter sp.]